MISLEQATFLTRKAEEAFQEQPGLLSLQTTLLRHGGTHCCFSGYEEDLDKLLDRGEVLRAWRVRMRKGEPSHCHTNAVFLWDSDRDGLELMTGYALSEDGIWRQHSWVFDPVTGHVLETTCRRLIYFGFKLNQREAQQFFFDNCL